MPDPPPPARHLLVVVAILCSGFIRPTPKQDDTTLLDVIPANLVDAVR